MEELIKKLKELAAKNLDFQLLGDFIYQYDFSSIDYPTILPEIQRKNDYARNILMMNPIEVALLRWPPLVESAIHFHQGFYGYVVVINGECLDVTYKMSDKIFHCIDEKICCASKIVNEPDGTIHKILNPSIKQELITLHIYYPPLESFNGMEIFDIENERIGVLSRKAETASWSSKPGHFTRVQENAFSFEEEPSLHKIILVNPKPTPERIHEALIDYYSEQAKIYHKEEQSDPVRNAYTNTINSLVAKEMTKRENIAEMLFIASGTGKRALKIKELYGKEIALTGVDMNINMISQADVSQIDIINTHWLDADLPEDFFDAATFLYSFGHIPSKKERLASLVKLNRHMKLGGLFFYGCL